MSLSRVSILGASRGLGRAFFNQLNKAENSELFVCSRKKELLEKLKSESQRPTETFCCDFSRDEEQSRLLQKLESWQPTNIFYFAGGGPYGEYDKKQWKDHQWALEVNLRLPMKLLHFAPLISSLEQLVFIGSAIAENSADPFASSYAACKHGLRGLVSSVYEEKKINYDLRLFSPSYMDTELLPKGALPRQRGDKIHDPMKVAKELLQWSKTEGQNFHWHPEQD